MHHNVNDRKDMHGLVSQERKGSCSDFIFDCLFIGWFDCVFDTLALRYARDDNRFILIRDWRNIKCCSQRIENFADCPINIPCNCPSACYLPISESVSG